MSYVVAEPSSHAAEYDDHAQYDDYRPQDRERLTDYGAHPRWNTYGENPYAQVQNYSLYGRRGPEPKHVRQSNLGNCHMMASLAGVASDPDAIRNMVQEAGPGRYHVNLHDPETMRPVRVHVDDHLPTDMEPEFHRSRGKKVVWPHVAEQGYVKLHDARESVRKNRDTSERQTAGYPGIEGGTGIGAMQSFTGRRADYLPIRNMSDRELLRHLDKANTPGVAVLAGSNFDYTEGMKSGIMPRHAYTVVGTRYSRSRGEYMVEVRNPHGGDQYPVLGTRNETIEMPLSRFRASFETVTAPIP
ncbi:C2 family cysteine protease [Cystobacter ferrugineus]|uniref:Calpain catalytic domain-containing protein n=1 Tax=Cystobacter ferrugineus TaxID=83449 RepID=A0A1L9BBQ1_9BACT|nr:C2 family cysteine protease [Cystobacter ferrugineus]OJH39697.1 hypothetical protein BON30_19690 [Cystobacter ferrugineus]